MNNLGVTSVIDPEPEYSTIFDFVPLNHNQFFVSQFVNYLIPEALYEINGWGYGETQERSELKDIEV